ncbi:MAG: hypothetical protein MUF21_09685, partial [Gemmatimonadaceae bacterium]|nr:hypothetical protein [Gemmatimonadaceae bacterium]
MTVCHHDTRPASIPTGLRDSLVPVRETADEGQVNGRASQETSAAASCRTVIVVRSPGGKKIGISITFIRHDRSPDR